MKTGVLFLLSSYQVLVSPLLHTLLGNQQVCRFSPTCSAYAKENIARYGIILGTKLAMKRFLSCQPLFAI